MNGDWRYTLSDNTTNHPTNPGSGTPEGISDDFNVRVTDSDGDITDGTEVLSIDINDDGPIISPQNAILANEADNSVTAQINTIGADGLKTVTITPANGVGDGDAVVGTVGGVPSTPLTAFGGQSIEWNDNGNGSWSGVVSAGQDNAGETVFTVTPDDSGTGSYTVLIDDMDGLDGKAIPFGFDFTTNGPTGAKTGEMLFFANEDGPINFKNNELNDIDAKVDPGDLQVSVTASSFGAAVDVNSSQQGMGVDTGAEINGYAIDVLTLNISTVSDPANGDSSDDIPFQINNVNLTLDHLNTDEVAHWKVGYHDTNGNVVWIAEGDYQGISDGGSSPASDEILTLDVTQFTAAEIIDDANFNPLTAGFDVIELSDGSPESTIHSGYRVANMTTEGDEIPGFDSSIEMDITVTDNDNDSSSTETVSIIFDSTGDIDGIDGESDAIKGSSGIDTILAVDDVADTIDGGLGEDIIHYDGPEGDPLDTLIDAGGDDTTAF
jgi:hypothetical protein